MLCFWPEDYQGIKTQPDWRTAKLELQGVGQHSLKAGTPTMGGLIVLLAVLLPTVLWANVINIYVVLILLITAWLGGVGFIDDYFKVVKKKPKGLIGRYKLSGKWL
jgi:phospho-N-acetylmuramoyl-pentapeptide-transferase